MDGGSRFGTQISVKRACDGPHGEDGYLLGDVTEVEMVGAVRDRPLNTVQHECGLCRGFHVLFANPDRRAYAWGPEDGDTWTIEVLCPGKLDGADVAPCATWEPCGCVPPTEPLTVEFEQFISSTCPVSPTGEHRWLVEMGFVGAPTGGCWYQDADGVPASAANLITEPGMYPVNVDMFDEVTPVFELADLSRRDAIPAPA
jgi:hypothetical protein